MSCYKNLVVENQELREQLVELAKHVRGIQDEAVQENISYELEALLRAVPVALLYPSMYPF